jgi:isocitrate/isopropylmalate dehydrogenase
MNQTNSYPQATGLNIANPLATILSAAMMMKILIT